jgi:very-short-patch-repair endonuclease
MKENIKLPIFYGASIEIFRRADLLRNSMTEAESLLWQRLNYNKLDGYKFRRQHPINKFIADFYCHKVKLIIELDGEIHRKKEVAERDEGREFVLKNFDLEIIRFNNKDVLQNTEGVISRIRQKLNQLDSKPL